MKSQDSGTKAMHKDPSDLLIERFSSSTDWPK